MIDNGTVDTIMKVVVMLSDITLAGNASDASGALTDLLGLDVDIEYVIKRAIMMVPQLNAVLLDKLKANHPKYVAMAERLMVLS